MRVVPALIVATFAVRYCRPRPVERLVVDAFKRYQQLMADLAATLRKAPELALPALASVFETIPVDAAGRATVPLDLQRVLNLSGENSDGSGGRI